MNKIILSFIIIFTCGTTWADSTFTTTHTCTGKLGSADLSAQVNTIRQDSKPEQIVFALKNLNTGLEEYYHLSIHSSAIGELNYQGVGYYAQDSRGHSAPINKNIQLLIPKALPSPSRLIFLTNNIATNSLFLNCLRVLNLTKHPTTPSFTGSN